MSVRLLRIIVLLPLLVLAASGLSGCSAVPELPSLPLLPWQDEPEPEPEPPKPKVVVTVTGVEADMGADVAAHTSIAGKNCDISESLFLRVSADVTDEVVLAMQAFGYYGAEATAKRIFESPCPRVEISVRPGEPVRVTAINLELTGPGADNPVFAEVRDAMPLKLDAPLRHAYYADSKALLQAVAQDNGYFDARFAHAELRVSPETGTAEVFWAFDTGGRYRFGPLNVTQDGGFLDEDLIRRLLEYQAGDDYSLDKVAAMNRALTQSPYFASADLQPDLASAEAGSVPMTASLNLTPKHHFRVGVSASTDDGPRVVGSYTNRRFNARGDRFSAAIDVSVREQSVDFGYSIPREHPRSEWLTLATGVKREETDSSTSTEFQLSASDTKLRRWGWLETRYIERNRTSFSVGEEDDISSFFVFGTRFSKSKGNNALLPTRGYLLNVEVRGAAETLLSDTSFAKIDVFARHIYGLPWGARFLTRAELGYLAVDQFSVLPPAERFFAGGDNSVRGYIYESLGPVGDDGRVLGGSELVVGSVELEQPVYGPFAVATFFDIGNAFGGSGRNVGFKRSAGLGLRWYSPVGPMRVDFAHPIDGDEAFMVHLRLGPDL